jgi:hypothetical protein
MSPESEKQDPRKAVVAKAMGDPEFKERLKADPRAALSEMNINPRYDMDIKVHEDDGNTVNFVLPAIQHDRPLTDEELSKISSGGHYSTDDNW